MTESERILDCLGRDAMQRLCDEFGGETIYVPLRVPEPERDERVKRMFDEQLRAGSTCMSSYRNVAEEEGLSIRRVQQIVAESFCRI